MSTKTHLVIVAHPDDETIFFGGLILSNPRVHWRVICVTDGNADGQGALRAKQFESACSHLGVKSFEMWDQADIYEKRLDVERLCQRLAELPPAERVFTHGPLGEYGHPHHQDVSWCAHKVFAATTPVWSPAYNAFGTKCLRLRRKAFDTKAWILSRIYLSETARFARLLPLTATETFHMVPAKEVDTLYSYFTNTSPLPEESQLKTYKWYRPYLEEQKNSSLQRLF